MSEPAAEQSLNPADAGIDSLLRSLAATDTWYVGLSGGLDSTVLLHILQQWCAARPDAPRLHAVHVNHQLSPNAPDWQRHCESLCEELGIELLSRYVDVRPAGAGLEAAARSARYRVFEEILQPGQVLFTAHHLDDQIETVLLRLLRGTGVQGLAAMPVTRPLGAGTLARPLLSFERAVLQRYLEANNRQYVDDESNRDPAFDRNYLRREVLPLIERRWPGYRRSVSRLAGLAADATATLDRLLPPMPTIYSAMGDPGIPLVELTGVARATAALKLRAWLQRLNCPAPVQRSMREFLRQLIGIAEDSQPRLECGPCQVQRFREGIYMLPEPLPSGALSPLDLEPGKSATLPGGDRLSLHETDGASGIALHPGEPLTVRWRRGGERCQLRGRRHSCSLKNLLQEMAIPPWWRDRIPLIYAGDELVAVGDLVACERSDAGDGRRWRVKWERPWQEKSSAGIDFGEEGKRPASP